ncbi:hypothetical protein PTKIN_Ptkin06aG0121500 [Pterospermum kingtungense]
MRDRMERFVILPFSVGCVSESSVAVAVQQQQPPRRSKPAAETNSTDTTRTREENEESLSGESMKYSLKLLPDISTGFHRLFKGFKTFSQIFEYKEEVIEETEEDMEIGLPTEVKHVAHIGLDGSSCSSTSMGSWDNIFSPTDLFTFPMETQAAAAATASPLVQAST